MGSSVALRAPALRGRFFPEPFVNPMCGRYHSMRSVALVLFMMSATLVSAAPPAHLKHLPPTVLYHGPALAGLEKVAAGEAGRLWLPGGEREFKVQSVVEHGAGIATRFGKIEGFGQGAVTQGPDGGFGRLTEGTTVWFLEYREGRSYAVRAGEGGLAIAADDTLVRGTPPPRAPALRKASTVVQGPARVIDIAALYDPDFAARYPGGLTSTRIQHFVALANQALVDSGVDIVLRVVTTAAASGAVAPSVLDNVDAMFAAGQTGGAFAGQTLNTIRTNTGADIISFFRVHDMYTRDACGVAYFPNGPGQWQYGVNVVVDGEHAGSICDDYVFAHEVGHNLGAGHQSPDAGYFAGSHAFVRLGQFNTIMGSFGTGKADRFRRVGYFSNPAIACGNLPCGVANVSDNSGTMNQLRDLVADYRASLNAAVPARPVPVNADSDGDGVIDRIDAFPFDALQTVDADGDGQPASRDAFPMNSTEWLDSDGGGLGDNADTDDDNDGVLDANDPFPLDQSESADSDLDGTGNNADALDADAYEQRDTDLDGIGDRADTDDDQDGTSDVATLATAAEGELLVADGATDRILRFDGSTMAPLGTLTQLAPGEVTIRSEMGSAPSGELYFVAGSEVRRLDRLRSATPELFLATAFHSDFGTGFPASPLVAASGDVVVAEWGQGATAGMRPARRADGLPPLWADYWSSTFGNTPRFHFALDPSGDVVSLDGLKGARQRLRYDLRGGFAPAALLEYDPNAVTANASGSIAVSPLRRLFWVDRRDGAVRNLLLPGGSGAAVPALTNADARAITIGPDGVLYVAKRSGGVQRYDSATGADLGVALTASATAEPLALAWAPKILDASMPALPTPPALVVFADPGTTPAVGGATPPAPPCTTACIVIEIFVTTTGGGGLLDPLSALLLMALAGLGAALARRRTATSS